jgi:1-deoxy-D-xylulose-5-phosphate reductoisomerase
LAEVAVEINSISLLGSTGSIGVQALEVCRSLGVRVAALAANRSITLLEDQIRAFRPGLAAVADEKAAAELKGRVRDLDVRVLCGIEGVCEAASLEGSDLVLNAIVGMAGLTPTLAAIAAKKPLALANKESLVVGGELVTRKAAENGVKILPVDSEHSAIFQCLQGCTDTKRQLKRIILTASGGPFFGRTRPQLEAVTPSQALRNPNWTMGAKITIDSATLMNKGMELIEAVWLFGLQPEAVEIVVHRESVLHSAVEFVDNAVLAQLGVPDMRIPIQYALTWPGRMPSESAQLDLLELGTLSFAKPDEETFKCLRTCKDAIRRGGLAPAAANGANEQAVELFLKGAIGFNDIGDLVESAAVRQESETPITLDGIIEADRNARRFVVENAI